MTKQTDTHQDEQGTLYEIGYLVVPTVAEEQLPGVVQELKGILEKHRAIISKEGAPMFRELAYEITKISGSNRQKFDKAYFGWVTFTASPADAPAINKQVENMPQILRYILIKTDDEIVIAPQFGTPAADQKGEVAPAGAPAPVAKTSPEELDKKIDNLVSA